MLLHMSCHNDFTFLLRRARDLYIPSRVLTSFSFLLSKSYCSYSIKKKINQMPHLVFRISNTYFLPAFVLKFAHL